MPVLRRSKMWNIHVEFVQFEKELKYSFGDIKSPAECDGWPPPHPF